MPLPLPGLRGAGFSCWWGFCDMKVTCKGGCGVWSPGKTPAIAFYSKMFFETRLSCAHKGRHRQRANRVYPPRRQESFLQGRLGPLVAVLGVY